MGCRGGGPGSLRAPRSVPLPAAGRERGSASVPRPAPGGPDTPRRRPRAPHRPCSRAGAPPEWGWPPGARTFRRRRAGMRATPETTRDGRGRDSWPSLGYSGRWSAPVLIEVGHPFPVPVKDPGGTGAASVDATLGGLAPARVRHLGVDVRLERVLQRLEVVPEGGRLLLDELDLHHRLRPLVSVLPGDDHPERRAVLLGQLVAEEAHRGQGHLVHGLLEAEALVVGPAIPAEVHLARGLLLVEEGEEADVASLVQRLAGLEDHAQGDADPGHVHVPRLHAAVPVQALLEGKLQDLVDVPGAGLADQPGDFHRPGPGPEGLHMAPDVLLLGKLVEVVVAPGRLLVAM